MLKKKPGVLKFKILARDSSKKMIDIRFYCKSYENSKGFAIIQDFTAHWAIRSKEMVIVLKFDSVRMQELVIYDLHIKSNSERFPICLAFIMQQAVKS